MLVHHFERAQLAMFAVVDARLREARVRGEGAGHCSVCTEVVPSRRGRRHSQSRTNHLFNECKEYPWSKSYNG